MKRVKTVLIVLLLLACGVGWAMALYHRERRVEAEAAWQSVELEAVEMKRVAVVKDKNMGKQLEHLQDELATARRVGAPPLITTRIVTREVIVEVPTEHEVLVPAPCDLSGSVEGTTVPNVRVLSPVALRVSGSLEGLFASNQKGEVFFKGKFFTHLARDDWASTVELPIDDENSVIEVSGTMSKALKYYLTRRRFAFVRGPRHWRLGLSFGLGVCASLQPGSSVYSPADTYQGYSVSAGQSSVSLDPCAFLGWGVQL